MENILKSIYRKYLDSKFRFSKTFRVFNRFFVMREEEQVMDYFMENLSFNNIKGDYYEFGVFEGDSFSRSFHLAQKYFLKDMNFYAFDSFEGLPKVDKGGVFKTGQYACNVEQFEKNMIKRKVDMSKVYTIKGFYKNTLNEKTKNKFNFEKVALIYMDCNLYESTLLALNFVKDYIQDGTILILHDYFCLFEDGKKGEKKAFEEWIELNKDIKVTPYRTFGWGARSFVLEIKKDETNN